MKFKVGDRVRWGNGSGESGVATVLDVAPTGSIRIRVGGPFWNPVVFKLISRPGDVIISNSSFSGISVASPKHKDDQYQMIDFLKDYQYMDCPENHKFHNVNTHQIFQLVSEHEINYLRKVKETMKEVEQSLAAEKNRMPQGFVFSCISIVSYIAVGVYYYLA